MVKRYPKYRIVRSFTYKGPEGNWPQDQWVSVGPGEETPKLQLSYAGQLISLGVINEIDLYGENVESSKQIILNGEEINKFLEGKTPDAIIQLIGSSNYSMETLTGIYAVAEKMRLKLVTDYLEQRLETRS